MDDDDGRVSTPLLSPTEEAGAPLITAETVPDNAGEGYEDGGHDPDANVACSYCGDPDKIEAPAPALDPSFFGRKTIGVIGGIVLVVNNVAGPGMLAFPQARACGRWWSGTDAGGGGARAVCELSPRSVRLPAGARV